MRPDGPRDTVAGPDDGPQPPFPLRLNGKVIKGFGRGSSEVSSLLMEDDIGVDAPFPHPTTSSALTCSPGMICHGDSTVTLHNTRCLRHGARARSQVKMGLWLPFPLSAAVILCPPAGTWRTTCLSRWSHGSKEGWMDAFSQDHVLCHPWPCSC